MVPVPAHREREGLSAAVDEEFRLHSGARRRTGGGGPMAKRPNIILATIFGGC